MPKARCCTCGSRDVWLLHDGVLHLVGCRRCGRTGPGALSAPLAVEAWNDAGEARFSRGLPPGAEMMAPCVCEAQHPDAGVQLSGQGDALRQWLEGADAALCELAMPMADGRGWTLFALRVESVRREGDSLLVGGGFVRQDDRQRGLLARLLETVEERAGGDVAR